MTSEKDKFRALLKKLGKRPRTVLKLILEKGSVSTYELGKLGYDQPPRAAQDLKEAGVKLITKFGRHPKTGSRMAIYFLAPNQDLVEGKGRIAFPKRFRDDLLKHYDHRCNLCHEKYSREYLQIDHRIPYIIAGESKLIIDDFQLLCGSHQRLKSWICEHCQNRKRKRIKMCRECYWAFPDKEFKHVATHKERRIDLVWKDSLEIAKYDILKEYAKNNEIDLQGAIKRILEQYFQRSH